MKDGWRKRVGNFGAALTKEDLWEMVGMDGGELWFEDAARWERLDINEAMMNVNHARDREGQQRVYSDTTRPELMYIEGGEDRPERWRRPEGVHLDGMDLDE